LFRAITRSGFPHLVVFCTSQVKSSGYFDCILVNHVAQLSVSQPTIQEGISQYVFASSSVSLLHVILYTQRYEIIVLLCEISGFRRGVAEVFAPVGYYAPLVSG
jgi:hypothetical protein